MRYDMLPVEREPYNEPLFEEQFERFIEAAGRNEEGQVTRRWLHDAESDVKIYVRENVRSIGPPIPGLVKVADGRVKQFASSVPCLEISNLEYQRKLDAVSVEDFKLVLSKIYSLSPWSVISLDEIGAPEIVEWCLNHGWRAERDTKIVRIIQPDDPNVIHGTAETVRMVPLRPELPAGVYEESD